MSEWIVPLSSPRLREQELDALLASYRSGWWTIGPETEGLEAEICEYTGAEHAVAVSSCTAALHLACLGLGVGPGDSVVMPSINFAAAANVVAAVGARPVFAEICGLTEPWLDPAAVEPELERGARFVINVAYGGHPGATAELAELADRCGAVLIEDIAHAAGSHLGGRHLGTFGTAGAMSFSASKNLGIGEGGMLITSDPVLAERARSMRWQGISSSTAARHSEAVSSYDVERAGLNYRFDDPRAAAVRLRLRRLDSDNEARAQVAAAYREALTANGGIEPTAAPPPEERNSHCMFTAVLAEEVDRDGVRLALAERGIQTSLHFSPLHRTAAYRAAAPERLPATEDYARRALTLPLFPEMSPRDVELVVGGLPSATRGGQRSAA